MSYETFDFENLVGKTIIGISKEWFDSKLIFFEDEFTKYEMYHDQECCEDVHIEEIHGDLEWLVNSPILMAEVIESSSVDESSSEDEGQECLWTFYKIATIKGSVTIRWYGSSNGYYSMGVDFKKITKEGSDE